MTDDRLIECKNNEYEVSLLYAMRRKKDQINEEKSKEMLFRQIVKDREVDLSILKEKIKGIKGIWRIYETVNKRDCKKAMIELNIILTKDRDCINANKIESVWKTCLMQPENKSTKYILIDVDTNDVNELEKIVNIIRTTNISYIIRKTPNGFHIKINHSKEIPFDTRLLTDSGIKNIEIKRDALLFLEIIDNT